MSIGYFACFKKEYGFPEKQSLFLIVRFSIVHGFPFTQGGLRSPVI